MLMVYIVMMIIMMMIMIMMTTDHNDDGNDNDDCMMMMIHIFILECDEQTASANGSRDGNGTSSQFTCNVGYNLIGSSVTECLDDGTGWSADPPSCGMLVDFIY
jgi:competence protein ComGC